MGFKVGDYAVYPLHGVGVVEDVAIKEIGGMRQKMFVLRILENNMTVMVPVATASNVGLREVMNREKVREVYEVLSSPPKKSENQTWNRRYRDYLARIKTGDTSEVGLVLRDLAGVRANKNLSFGERKMFDTAWSLLVREIALARDLTVEEIGEDFEAIFAGKGDEIMARMDKAKRKRSKKSRKK